MEKLIYFFLPMAVVFKLFKNDKDSNFDLFIKYLGLCFINNLICAILTELYFPSVKIFKDNIDFFIKYSLLSLGVALLMALLYRLFKNFWQVKFEVVHEKKK